jgi:hypothetical protein
MSVYRYINLLAVTSRFRLIALVMAIIYKYNGKKDQYSSHCVELQIRSTVQHSWATAVEVVGTFTRQALKAGQGSDLWLSFFKLASISFEDIENRKLSENASTQSRLELIRAIDELSVLPKLRAFVISTEHLGRNNQNGTDYFLLILDMEQFNIQIQRYSADQLDKATDQYASLEKEFQHNIYKDVVLVSASSVHGLRKAYPNYFADTSEFAKNLEKILESNAKISSV